MNIAGELRSSRSNNILPNAMIGLEYDWCDLRNDHWNQQAVCAFTSYITCAVDTTFYLSEVLSHNNAMVGSSDIRFFMFVCCASFNQLTFLIAARKFLNSSFPVRNKRSFLSVCCAQPNTSLKLQPLLLHCDWHGGTSLWGLLGGKMGFFEVSCATSYGVRVALQLNIAKVPLPSANDLEYGANWGVDLVSKSLQRVFPLVNEGVRFERGRSGERSVTAPVYTHHLLSGGQKGFHWMLSVLVFKFVYHISPLSRSGSKCTCPQLLLFIGWFGENFSHATGTFLAAMWPFTRNCWWP